MDHLWVCLFCLFFFLAFSSFFSGMLNIIYEELQSLWLIASSREDLIFFWKAVYNMGRSPGSLGGPEFQIFSSQVGEATEICACCFNLQPAGFCFVSQLLALHICSLGMAIASIGILRRILGSLQSSFSLVPCVLTAWWSSTQVSSLHSTNTATGQPQSVQLVCLSTRIGICLQGKRVAVMVGSPPAFPFCLGSWPSSPDCLCCSSLL